MQGWDGGLLDTNAVIARFGTSAAQLNRWRKDETLTVFGLSREKRRYPAEQFMAGGEPVAGISELLWASISPDTLWLWLVMPCATLDGQRHVDLLKGGAIGDILAAATRHFDAENWQ